MDILESIIENLTSDEVRRFKILSNRFKADEEKKMLALFDSIRSGEAQAEDAAPVERMYGEENDQTRNRYYRLRNKLLNNLEKSLLFYHFNYKNTLEAYNFLQIASLLRERGLFRETLYYLRRAEKVAHREDMFGALEIIYDEMVRLGTVFEVDVAAVLRLRNENSEKLSIWRADQEVLALVTQELLRKNYGRGQHSQTVIETLEALRQRLEGHAHLFRSASGRIMILKTVVSILLQKEAFSELVAYVEATFAEFEAQDVFGDHQGLRIMMQVWRINGQLKLLRLDGLDADIQALWKDLERNRKQHFREYAFYYYSAAAYWHKLTGNLPQASLLLEEAIAALQGKSSEVQGWFLLISRADTFFCQGDFGQARATLRKALSHPVAAQLDPTLIAYASVLEAVCLSETGNDEAALALVRQMKKDMKAVIRDQKSLGAFVEVLARLAKTDRRKLTTGDFQHMLDTVGQSEIGGNQIILYEAFIRSRMQAGTTYYQAFLEEVALRKSKYR